MGVLSFSQVSPECLFFHIVRNYFSLTWILCQTHFQLWLLLPLCLLSLFYCLCAFDLHFTPVSLSFLYLLCTSFISRIIFFTFNYTNKTECFIPGIFKSTCYIDVRWFPFDVQRCNLKFGSWTYGGWSLDLQMIEADVTGYIANGEWDLVGKSTSTSALN